MELSVRDKELILLALDYYSNTRGGTAGAAETKELAVKLRREYEHRCS